MAQSIYALCALTSTVCAFLLLRAYAGSRYRLLLWAALCFVGLALNNVLLVVDKVLLPDIDLSMPRMATAFVAMLVLMYGLIFESK